MAKFIGSTRYLSDITAGMVVFLIALPLCLGIALASKAPAMSGILSGIVGGILVGALSGSHTSVSGPAAGLTAVIIAQIATLGSFEAFLAALFIAGLIQIAFGILKIGYIARFFPSSVIKGLLAAVGIILVLKQLPHLVGWDVDSQGDMAFWQSDDENTISEIGKMFFNLNGGATLIGLLCLSILIFWDKNSWLKKGRIPSAVFVVILGVFLNWLFSRFSPSLFIDVQHRVQIPLGNMFSNWQTFIITPNFGLLWEPAIYVAGFTIALVASLETLINLEAVDKIDPKQRSSPPNRELIAQGVGNTFLSLIGGLPVTSVIIRSSANINAGAQTRFATIIHGVLLFFCVLVVPQILNSIPLSCLAAILIVTGVKLASPKIAMQMWREGLNQFIPFVVTVAAIVFTDLLVGVLIGLATSIFFILQSNLRRPLQVITEQHINGEVLRVSLSHQVSFLNRAALSNMFETIPSGTRVLLDASQTDYVDADILDLINDFKDEAGPARQIQVSLFGFKEHYNLADCIHYDEHTTRELQQNATPSEVVQLLKEGNLRVRTGQRLHRNLSRQIDATSTGQFPLAVVLSCIDSRAPVELIFDLGIGDIFSVRVAGNVISEKILGSLEFACVVAGAKLIVVMGHTRCGAISSAVEYYKNGTSVKEKTGCTHLEAIVNDIQHIVKQNSGMPIPNKNIIARELFEEHISRQNVEKSILNIKERSPQLKQLIESGKVGITGCIYDVTSGVVDFPWEAKSVVAGTKIAEQEIALSPNALYNN